MSYKPKRAAQAPEKPQKAKKPKKEMTEKEKKKRKALIVIFSIILALLLAVIIFAVSFIWNKLGRIDIDNNPTVNTNGEFVDPIDGETYEYNEIDDATGNDVKGILKSWATNKGEKLKDKNIINILLIGSDASATGDRAHITDKGNTDVMMVVSIDKKNKTIKLVSFMRDSYTYMDGFDCYKKLNAACANGGANYLVETIENDYKFKIDGYILVDFDSFKEVIDIVGGVNVDVPKYVADHLNAGKDYEGKIKVPHGDGVKLNGEQALAFSRVRYTDADGDVSRVARQRQVINSLINKCKGASLSELNDVLDVILSNVRTDISKGKIVSYMGQAVTNGWAGYEIKQETMPTPDARYGGTFYGQWMWIVDYPKAAQNLQNYLYGKTNIHLEENRKTAVTAIGGYVTKYTMK